MNSLTSTFTPSVRTSEINDPNTSHFVSCWKKNGIKFKLIIDSVPFDNWHLRRPKSGLVVPPWFTLNGSQYELDSHCSEVHSNVLVHLEERCFFGLRNTELFLNNVVALDSDAVSFCRKPVHIRFDPSYYITLNVVRFTNLVHIEIDTLRVIPTLTFSECNLYTAEFKSCIEVDVYAFYKCQNLHSITFGKSTPHIHHQAFYMCRALQYVSSQSPMDFIVTNNLDIGDSQEFVQSNLKLLHPSYHSPCSSHSYEIILTLLMCLGNRCPNELKRLIANHIPRNLVKFEV